MMENVTRFKAALAAVLAAMTALWGWFGWLVLAWVACMAIDYITGYSAAAKNGEWSSDIAREGLWHKAGCICAVLAAGILDAVVGYLLGNIHGLELPGMVLLEQIKTIDKRRVKKYLGRMTRQQMDEIGEAIEEALGLYVPEEMEAP